MPRSRCPESFFASCVELCLRPSFPPCRAPLHRTFQFGFADTPRMPADFGRRASMRADPALISHGQQPYGPATSRLLFWCEAIPKRSGEATKGASKIGKQTQAGVV